MKTRIFSVEHRKNLSVAFKGRVHSTEIRKKISAAKQNISAETRAKISAALKGKVSPMKGKKHSAETRKKMSIAAKGKVSKIKGKKMSAVARKNMSAAQKLSAKINPNFGMRGKKHSAETKLKMSVATTKRICNINSFNKTVKYNKKYFRSNWEIEVAKWLDNENIIWEYESEKCIHLLETGYRYIIDFYLPKLDIFIEVKGWWDDYSIYKFNEASKTKDIRIIDKRNIDNLNLELTGIK